MNECTNVFTCVCDRDVVMLRTTRACCTLSVYLLFSRTGSVTGTPVRRVTPFPNGSDHAIFPSVSCRPPQSRTRGSRGNSSHLSCFYVLTVPFG